MTENQKKPPPTYILRSCGLPFKGGIRDGKARKTSPFTHTQQSLAAIEGEMWRRKVDAKF